MYKITCTNKNVFGEEKFNNDYRGFNKSPKETEEEAEARFNRLVKKCNKKFRCCDDDGEWYFKGVATTNDDDRAFQPLDEVGAAYGCTYIEYWNEETHEWEVL